MFVVNMYSNMPFYSCKYACYLFVCFFSIVFGDNRSRVQIRASFQVGIGKRRRERGPVREVEIKDDEEIEKARAESKGSHTSHSHMSPLMKRNHPPPF